MASFAAPPTGVVPNFLGDLHVKYIVSLSEKLSSKSSYEGAVTAHLRMSGVYWSVCALSILRPSSSVSSLMNLDAIIDWVFSCYDPSTGGFSGNVGHDAHLLYTLSALQLLALADRLSDPRLDAPAVASFALSLQNPDGSFAGDKWGEVDTRFSYCALSCLAILGRLERTTADAAATYIASCANFDGGFGAVPGGESHAGQIFCCVGALAIAKRLDLLDADLLSWWLAERQCGGGGLNGRPEKQADVCYSWWILSSLSILGKLSWINSRKLRDFILKCQDDEEGGIADRPDNMADVFHTFFGVGGLSLLGYFEGVEEHRAIDPIYALPKDVCEKLGL
jgi:geranylgeranyl transferase type-2 subunit beta